VPNSAELRPTRWLDWLFPLSCGLLFTCLWLSYRYFWLDDAFITFRYARNLAAGLGPVFNPGEPVEGYTSFLWMLASAVGFALADDALALSLIKVSGLAIGWWILWRTWSFPAPEPALDPKRGRRLLVVLLAANPVFIANCGDGMETPLYAALLLECARSFAQPPSSRSGVATGAFAALATWTRPESIALLIGLPLLLRLCRPGARLRSWFVGFAASSLPPVLGHIWWRLDYYGAPFPNTFYAKASGDLLPRLAAGISDLAAFG